MANLRLAFHSDTLRFLGHKPAVSARALKQMEACEKRTALQLPASLREWYSLLGWEKAVSGNRERALTKKEARFPIGLEDVAGMLKSLQSLHERMEDYTRSGHTPMFVIGREPGNPYAWYVALDGSEDPPVFEVDRDVIQVANHFSEFLFGLVWEPYHIGDPHAAWKTKRCWLVAEKHRCSPGHLDFMREHYSEGVSHRSRYEETRRYPFYNSAGAVTIECADDPAEMEVSARWSFSASKADELVTLVTPLWSFGNLGKKLRSSFTEKFAGEPTESKDGEEALSQLKGKRK